MLNFARPFLVAGVPLVVASLWKVDSDATTALMVGFHQQRKGANLSSMQALRRAKLNLLTEPNGRFRNPFYWASFIITGGDAAF